MCHVLQELNDVVKKAVTNIGYNDSDAETLTRCVSHVVPFGLHLWQSHTRESGEMHWSGK